MNKIDPSIKNNLFSSDTTNVILAINQIKEKGNRFYLPLLFDLFNSNPEPEISKEIKKLLSTVKEKESASIFIEAIIDDKYISIRKALLTTCWQNGLDFSKYLSELIDIIITDDWEVAFEAFTIIDNMEGLPGEEIIESSKRKIKDALKTSNEQKSYFLKEIYLKL